MINHKNESPKLSPEERLARKRAAARLRQQRCRARKRQALLEKKRGEAGSDGRQRGVKAPTYDPVRAAANAVIHVPTPVPVSHRSQSTAIRYPPTTYSESWMRGYEQSQNISSERRLIYNCVSFDSQKSIDDARSRGQNQQPSTPPRSVAASSEVEPATSSIKVVTPNRPSPLLTEYQELRIEGSRAASVDIVKDLSIGKTQEVLVSEEEAAVAAMLSLKTALTLSSQELVKKSSDSDVAAVITNDGCNDVNTNKGEQSSPSPSSKEIAISQHQLSSSSNKYPTCASDNYVGQHSTQPQNHHQHGYQHYVSREQQQHLMQHHHQSQQIMHRHPPPRSAVAQLIPSIYYQMQTRLPPMPSSHHPSSHYHQLHHPNHPQHHFTRGVYYPPVAAAAGAGAGAEPPRYAVAYD